MSSRLTEWAGTFIGLYSLAALLACPGFARAKTDVIVMKNGDRITGEVKNLENGVLRVELDYVDGTIQINWLKVDRLESKVLFLVHLEDGSIYSAKVVTREAIAGTPTQIEIQPVGEESVVIDRATLVRMTQTSTSIWQRFSGDISLGSTYSKGNSATQFNVGSGIDYLETRWGASLNYGSNLSASSGATTATRNQLNLIGYRLLPWKNYFYAGTVSFLQSSVQGIQRQANVAGSVGRFLKNTNRVRFSVLGGIGWQRTNYSQSVSTQQPIPDQQPIQVQESQNIPVAAFASTLQIFTFKKTRLNFNAGMAPALNGQGRIFSTINANYYLKLFGKINWNLSFYGNWDTQPPAHLQGSDYGATSGLSYTFGNK